MELMNKEFVVYPSLQELDQDYKVDESKDILMICRNCDSAEVSNILNDRMRVNPIIYHEVMMNAPVELYQEFNDDTMFFQFVIGVDRLNLGKKVVVQMVMWGNFGVIFIRNVKDDVFEFDEKLIKEHHFQAKVTAKPNVD